MQAGHRWIVIATAMDGAIVVVIPALARSLTAARNKVMGDKMDGTALAVPGKAMAVGTNPMATHMVVHGRSQTTTCRVRLGDRNNSAADMARWDMGMARARTAGLMEITDLNITGPDLAWATPTQGIGHRHLSTMVGNLVAGTIVATAAQV